MWEAIQRVFSIHFLLVISNIEVMRMKGVIINDKLPSVDVYLLPTTTRKKYMNSEENLYVDIGPYRVKKESIHL